MPQDARDEPLIGAVSDLDEPAVVIKPVARGRLEELEAEARYHRERYDLYRAKTYGPRPTSDSRLRELERMHQGAASRLRRARAAS
ncbi:MAG TPA: hypothetical protein VGN13_12115 [Solirubrobacteraceae bacterium]|jgi:hypothetical protein